MAHEISITNGVASYADSRVRDDGRVDAWHRLGTPVGHAMTAEEALEAAHLANWNVRKVPLWADLRDDGFAFGGPVDTQHHPAVLVPRKYATIFDNPVTHKITPIAVVGDRYTVIQPEEKVQFANALIDASSGDAHFETAGALRNYSQTFLTMKLPNTMVLEGLDGSQDITNWYLSVFNSYDGSSKLFGIITNTRVVCANTARVAIAGARSRFDVPHTSGWQGTLQLAREALGLSFEYQEAYEAEARSLFEQPFSTDEAKTFSEELVELSKVERDTLAATKRQNTASSILKLFVESPTIKGTPIEGTKYGAFNAVTEFVDHFQGVRGSGDDVAAAHALRATRTLLQASTGGGLKASAWALLTK